jgi:hypothetical protein
MTQLLHVEDAVWHQSCIRVLLLSLSRCVVARTLKDVMIRSEALTARLMKIQVFWNLVLRGLANGQ